MPFNHVILIYSLEKEVSLFSQILYIKFFVGNTDDYYFFAPSDFKGYFNTK